MNRLSLLLVVLLAFAAGAALGYFITPTPPRVDRAAPQSCQANEAAREDDKVEKPAAPVEADRRNDRKSPDEPSVPAPKNPPASNATLSELIERISVELPPSGNGKITGAVLTTERTPLANVLIRLRGWSTTPNPIRGPEPPSIEEEVKALVQRRKFAAGSTLEARSAADGTFEISGLAEIDYSIEAKLDGYVISGANGLVKAGAKLKLTAAAVVRVPIKVVNADGTPVVSASLRHSSEPSRSGYAGTNWMPERPYLDMRPGEYYLWAIDNKNPHMASETVSLQVELGVAPAEVLLTLVETPGIKGKVISPENPPTAWPNVQIAFYGKETPPAKPDLNQLRRTRSPHRMELGPSYSNGSYSFAGLEPGNYLVYLELNGTIAAFAAVTVSTGVVTQDLEVLAPKREECLVVWAYGPNGKLLSDVQLYVTAESKSGGGRAVGNAQPRDDGSYWMLKPPSGRDPAATKWFLTGNSASHGTKSIEISIEQQEVRLDFDAPGRLEITLSNYASSELKGKLRILMRLKDDLRSQPPRMFEPKLGGGVWRSGPAAPGTYTVEIQHSRSDWNGSTLATHEVVVNAGANTVTLPTPEVYTLTVRLKEAKAGQFAQLSGSQGRWEELQSDANGEVVFSGLGAGTYTIRVGNERMTVEVNATTTVAFTPR